MADAELNKVARAYGVAASYADWRGREVQVSDDTLKAVLGALGADVSTPAAVRETLARLREERRTRLLPPILFRRTGRPAALRVPWGARGADEVWLDMSTGGTVELHGTTVRAPDGIVKEYHLPPGLPEGWHRIRARVRSKWREETAPLLLTPERLPPPPRAWGLTCQLYSVPSRESWGMGDLHDLAGLAAWSGRELGAGFVLVNPLHATEPVAPIGASPYSPVSRRFASPLYLRVEDVPEYATLPSKERERLSALAARARGEAAKGAGKGKGKGGKGGKGKGGGKGEGPVPGARGELDRDAVWEAKREALEALFALPRGPERQRAYEAYRHREGAPLTAFATWSALSEEHGADWRRWPAELRDAENPAVARAAERLAGRVEFHAWLQWQLDEQLAAAQSAAVDAGMPIGIVHDLAVGVHPGGADAWMYRPMFAPGMSVGAPPDEFNQKGQDWGQPPWHPVRLAEAAYLPYRGMLAAALRHGGGLRLDHAMQVSRLWWVPEGGSPAEGTYVAYDRDAMLSTLVWEAAQAGAVVVGEDLGTVEPAVREDLAARGILGTSLLWFERDAEGRPRRPGDWRETSLATVGTHDMPPTTGFLHGDHIELRDRLGLLTRSVADEIEDHRAQLTGWLHLLHDEGLLTTPPGEILDALLGDGVPGEGPTRYDAEVTAALHAFLARTPARLIGVSLADTVGERRTQNQPGTVDEYPNWRVPLADAEGRPVLLDDLPDAARLKASLAPLMDRAPDPGAETPPP
ncbi:4-alpha-glucanotransferase [Actinomadura viridis]|uniref:4-alpha-glucanotransferase n=1 Tax=Actinomadura viridis TaxID=58110 RepID=UPI0036B94476